MERLRGGLPRVEIRCLSTLAINGRNIHARLLFRSQLARIRRRGTVRNQRLMSKPVVFLRQLARRGVLLHLQFPNLRLAFLPPLLARVLRLPPSNAARMRRHAIRRAAVGAILRLRSSMFSHINRTMRIVGGPYVHRAIQVVFLIRGGRILCTVLPHRRLVRRYSRRFLTNELPRSGLGASVDGQVCGITTDRVRIVRFVR